MFDLNVRGMVELMIVNFIMIFGLGLLVWIGMVR